MNFSDKVQCYRCKKDKQRFETVILQTPKGKFRLCLDCYSAYEQSKENQDFQEAKGNVKLYGIDKTDAFELMDKKKEFIKNMKEGIYIGPQNKH